MNRVQCPNCGEMQEVRPESPAVCRPCARCGRAPSPAPVAPALPGHAVSELPPAAVPLAEPYAVPPDIEAGPVRAERPGRSRPAAEGTSRFPSRLGRLRQFRRKLREHAFGLNAAALLLMVPLWVETYGRHLGLGHKLALGLFLGLLAGGLACTELRYAPLSLVCGVLAGVLPVLALHSFVVSLPPPAKIKARELAMVWMITCVPPGALYYALLHFLAVGGFWNASDGRTEQCAAWGKRALLFLCFVPFSFLGFGLAALADVTPRRIMGVGMALLFLGAGLLLALLYEPAESDAESERRNRSRLARGWKLSRRMLAAAAAGWALLAGVALFPVSRATLALALLPYSLALLLAGFFWLSLVCVRDGVEVRQGGYYALANPRRAARPYWLALSGIVALLASIAVLALHA